MSSRSDAIVMDEKHTMHFLVVRDRRMKHFLRLFSPTIWTQMLLNDIKKLDSPKVVVRHDPEPVLTSLLEGVKSARVELR